MGSASHSEPTRPADRSGGGSVLRASTIMAVLALLLSWLPVIGPLLAGFFGGRSAGTPQRALVAGLLPAILLGLLVGGVLAAFELPILGAVAGVGLFVVIAVQAAPLLLGAWFGGASQPASIDRPA